MKVKDEDSLELVRLCCRALDEKKAGDLRVLDVRGISSITSYLVIATATSDPHVRALRVELEKVLDGAGAHIVGVETSGESGWTVMDAFDVMIHVFSKELRSRYNLEKLWRDAHEVSVDRLLSRTPVTSRKKAAKPRKNAVKPKKKPPAKRKKTSK